MNRLVSGLLLAASAFAVCGFTAVPAVEGSRTAPSQAESANGPDASRVHLLDAEVAAQRGNWTESARLAEISYKLKPDLWNEFNLATAYQHTQRTALAIPLYLDLVDRGQFTHIYPIYSNDGSWPAPMLPFIADEAAHRLNQLGVPISPGSGYGAAEVVAVR